VLHARNQIRNKMASNPKLAAEVERLRQIITNASLPALPPQ
jgi:hypothetical protein